MKSILKILVLGVVPILAATAVVDQGLAADKGAQLIFQANSGHKNFISIKNTNVDDGVATTTTDGTAVTVLTQYYNDEMKQVLWYLRVIVAGGTVLVDPFDHEIPGTAKKDKDGKEMPGTATNVSEILDALPAMSTEKEAGMNSGRFVITVTAVGADVNGPPLDTLTADAVANAHGQVNVLFPDFLASGMHGTNNIDNCGTVVSWAAGATNTSIGYTKQPATGDTAGEDDCKKGTDVTTKNVGKLSVDNAEPIAYNHLTGHFTSALISTAAGGADQTASWGGTPVTREAVDSLPGQDSGGDAGIVDYQALNGNEEAANNIGGRLEEMLGGGAQVTENVVSPTSRVGYTNQGGNQSDDGGKIQNNAITHRFINGGMQVLPALHGGGAETHQVIHLLSVADSFGGAGKYTLMAAKTGYKVTLMDTMGDALPDPAAEAGPVFGGADDPKAPPGVSIMVEGIQVMTNANLAKCTGDEIDGAWTLADLTSIVPTAVSGAKDFAGLGADMNAAMNASPGSLGFDRAGLTCKKDYGDGDIAGGTLFEDADGVPTKDERTYTAGTLTLEQANTERSFVTTAQVVLTFITAESTFGASWSLKAD